MISPHSKALLYMLTHNHVKGICIDPAFMLSLSHRINESHFLQEFFGIQWQGETVKRIFIVEHPATWFLQSRQISEDRPQDTLAGLCSDHLLYVFPKNTTNEIRAAMNASQAGAQSWEVIEHE